MPKRVALAATAEKDFGHILEWTAGAFGARQANAYKRSLVALVKALGSGRAPPGVRARDEIGEGFRTLHMNAIGERGRHFVVFRVVGDEVQILRFLHDAMDIARHTPPDDEQA